MTGTIVALAGGDRTGTIRAEDGSYLLFSGAAVLGDFDTLAVGHRVTFEIEHHAAIRVFREPVRSSIPGRKIDELPDLRYTGFHQTDNVRSYRFDAVHSGHSVPHCVTVDLALLLKHRIGVQEAPALCLRKLTADLKASPDCGRHQLGDDDLLAFASTRAAALQRRKPRHSFPGRGGSHPPVPR